MDIFVDEIKEAEKIFENGFENKNWKTMVELIYLAKYYRSMRYGETRIKKALVEFCKSVGLYDEYFDRNKINYAVSKAMKYPIWKPIPVQITLSELDAIRSVKNFRWQKILFIMLVVAKEYKYKSMWAGDVYEKDRLRRYGYYVSDHQHVGMILKMAKVDMSINRFMDKVIYGLKDSGLVGGARDGDGGVTPLFFVNDKDAPVIVIDDFSDPIQYYIGWVGGKELVHCVDCGQEIEKTNNKRKRCPSCAQKRKNEQIKLIMMNKRKNVIK